MKTIVISVLISIAISACTTKITAEYYTREILSLIDALVEKNQKNMKVIEEVIQCLVDKLSKQ